MCAPPHSIPRFLFLTQMCVKVLNNEETIHNCITNTLQITTTTLKITTTFTFFYVDVNYFFIVQCFDTILDQTVISQKIIKGNKFYSCLLLKKIVEICLMNNEIVQKNCINKNSSSFWKKHQRYS